MTFLAPLWLALAAAAAAAVVAIHFIAWRLPRSVPLPTARFVPDEPARRASRTLRLSDVGLLALRAAIIMAGGVALARPTLNVAPSGTATVFAIERSAMIGDTATLHERVRALRAASPVLYVAFDTGAAVFQDETEAWTHLAQVSANQHASLTVGLLAATREARRLIREYETVNIVLVSTFTRGLFDEATPGVRGTWGDSLQIIRIAPALAPSAPGDVDLQSVGDDPVAAGIRLAMSHGMVRGASRVVRGVATSADSAWAAAGRVLVLWPREPTGTERIDGVHAGDVTTIAHFIRPVLAADTGRVVARWVDGSAATHESPLGTGCVRTIGFDVPDVGDFTLTPAFQRLAAALVAPCGGSQSSEVVADSVIAGLAAPSGAARSDILPDEVNAPNRLAAVIMMLAIILAIVEFAVRRRGRSGDAVVQEPAA